MAVQAAGVTLIASVTMRVRTIYADNSVVLIDRGAAAGITLSILTYDLIYLQQRRGVASVVGTAMAVHHPLLYLPHDLISLQKRRGVAEDSEGGGGRAGVSPYPRAPRVRG